MACACINSCYTSLAVGLLKGTNIKVDVTVGFPLGAVATNVKVFEAKEAIRNGAHELEMIINIGALKSGNNKFVEEDIKAVIRAAEGRITKVIIETCYLDEEEKVIACEIVKRAGADFVKTSSGFGSGGATVEDVKMMKQIVGDGIEVKAAGGINTFKKAIEIIQAGATRIGTSSGVAIMEGFKEVSHNGEK